MGGQGRLAAESPAKRQWEGRREAQPPRVVFHQHDRRRDEGYGQPRRQRDAEGAQGALPEDPSRRQSRIESRSGEDADGLTGLLIVFWRHTRSIACLESMCAVCCLANGYLWAIIERL